MLLKPMVNSFSSFSLTYQEHLGVWLLPPWNIFFYYQEHLFFYFSECSFSVAGSSPAPHPEVPRAVIRPLPYLHSFLGDLTIDMLRTQILFPVLTCRLNLKGMSSFLYFTSSFGCLNLKLSFRPIHFHHPQTCSFFPPNLANDNSFLVAQVKSHSSHTTLPANHLGTIFKIRPEFRHYFHCYYSGPSHHILPNYCTSLFTVSVPVCSHFFFSAQ